MSVNILRSSFKYLTSDSYFVLKPRNLPILGTSLSIRSFKCSTYVESAFFYSNPSTTLSYKLNFMNLALKDTKFCSWISDFYVSRLLIFYKLVYKFAWSWNYFLISFLFSSRSRFCDSNKNFIYSASRY